MSTQWRFGKLESKFQILIMLTSPESLLFLLTNTSLVPTSHGVSNKRLRIKQSSCLLTGFYNKMILSFIGIKILQCLNTLSSEKSSLTLWAINTSSFILKILPILLTLLNAHLLASLKMFTARQILINLKFTTKLIT